MMWRKKPTTSRFLSPEELIEGDIVMKLSDGRLFLIGSGGTLREPTWWQRVRDRLRKLV